MTWRSKSLIKKRMQDQRLPWSQESLSNYTLGIGRLSISIHPRSRAHTNLWWERIQNSQIPTTTWLRTLMSTHSSCKIKKLIQLLIGIWRSPVLTKEANLNWRELRKSTSSHAKLWTTLFPKFPGKSNNHSKIDHQLSWWVIDSSLVLEINQVRGQQQTTMSRWCGLLMRHWGILQSILR